MAHLATILVAGVLGMITLFHHEWWRDEAYSWLVVRSSHGIPDLIHNLGFNGNPKLYYLFVYWMRAVFESPLAVSISNFSFIIVSIVFFITAPFNRLQKALFAVGFFPLYQYGVIARCYSMIICLLFAYCFLKLQRPSWFFARMIILAVLCQIHVMAMGAACALLAIESWQCRKHQKWAPILPVIASLFFAAWQIIPPHQAYRTLTPGSPLMVFPGLANGFFPDFGLFHGLILQIACGLILWIASWIVIARHKAAIPYYLLLSVSLILISAILYSGHRWHHGFYFIYFIIAIWLSTNQPYTDRFSRRFITGLLLLHALIGGYAIVDDLRHPYSNGADVAQWIKGHNLTNDPIVGIEVFRGKKQDVVYKWEMDQIQPVLMHLHGKKMLDPVSMEMVPYWHHHDDIHYFPRWDYHTMQREFEKLSQGFNHPFLVIIAQERGVIDFSPPSPLQLLAHFPEPSDYGEHLSLYRFSSR